MAHSGMHIAVLDNCICVVRQSQLGTHNSSLGQYELYISARHFMNIESSLNLMISPKRVARDSWCWCILQIVPDHCNDDTTASRTL